MPTINMEQTGVNIKSFRTQMGISIRSIVEQTGVTERAVCKWQSGKTVPSIDNLVVLAKIFNVTIDQIVAVDQ